MSLLVQEAATARFVRAYAEEPQLVVWWATETECASALARRQRELGAGASELIAPALTQLDQLVQRWHEVAPAPEIRTVARRLLFTHPLRAADALQLAAALAARGDERGVLEFVCADQLLIAAARAEGLGIVGPED